ncbi:MAG: aspartyl protease family protein [Amphiplicatus sp.]
MFSVSGRYDRRQVAISVVVVGDLAASVDGSASILMEPLRALVDTGATSSSITPEAVRRIGLKRGGRRFVNTAGGMRRAPFYVFRIGPLHENGAGAPYVLDEPIAGGEFTLGGFNYDILLGMDVISRGDLTIRRNGTYCFAF